MNEAMYYGVPMMVMPVINDQPTNAKQVERLILGRRVRAFPTTAAIMYRQAMDVLGNQKIRKQCKVMEKEIRLGLSIDKVVDMIEGVL